MEQWRNYSILKILFITLLLGSCQKEEIIIIDEKPPTNPTPIVLYDTSLENHELNDGWFANNTHNVNNYLNASFMRGFTYIDYEGDGDMDVFICRPPFLNVGMANDALDYGIIINTEDGWEFKKDMIKTQLPYYASMITTSDLDNDGDGDIVVFIADDPGNYEGGTVPVEGAGGIYAYLWEDGGYELQVIEPYQEIGAQGYYHGGTLGDVNRDGLVDVVAGTDVIKVWFNNGDGTWTKQQLPSFEDYEKQYGLWVCSEFLVDINKDGNVDLIVGAPMDKYRDINSGTAEDGFANSTHIFLGTGSYPYYNQEPDIVLVNPYIDKSDWKNTHDCTFDISVVDWDNDGDLDIFTNIYKFYPTEDGHLINYYENNNNEFTFKNLFKDNQQYYQGCSSGFMKVYDIDNDGNKEILLESGSPDVSWECSEYNAYKLIGGKLQKTKI